MNGKIKLKLNKDFMFNRRKYEVIINGQSIGYLSNINPKIDHEIQFGKHKLIIKGENTFEEHNIRLGFGKIIIPIIVHHRTFFKPKFEVPRLLRNFIYVFLLFYAIVCIYGYFNWNFSIIQISLLPIIISILLSSNDKSEFKLDFK